MANELRTRDGLPFNFVDGLRIKGVDVTNWEKVFIDQGASYVGFTPVGNISATNVQTAIDQVDARLKVVEDIFSPGEDYGLLTTAATSVVDYGALI